MNFQQYLKQVKSEIREVSIDEVSANKPAVLIDVREGEEYNDGYIPGATWIPRGKLELRIEDAVPDRSQEVVLYCAGGNRSALAAKALAELGYTRVSSMAGGYGAWKRAGLPTAKPFIFTQDQKSRYARHLMLPEVGEAGQAKLLQAKVLLLGAGGLGAPAGLYLAAAGIGTLGLVDDDVVDESNLQRQVIHNTTRVGVPKVESAKQTINELNPDVKVRTHQLRLTS
jgi:sulfur-carrier protein adenylyltransferase/sulfurtransferase